ncbi:MAG: DEAD/DEAH box helicase [Dehalococcoidia bacterium]|nr:DEAD/DEAH box helicase [Dehalococcoidia bacterium]
MTPLRGLLRLLKGDQNPPAASPSDEPTTAASRNRRNAASPATGGGPILTDDSQSSSGKRRRGRRGGRGRGRGEGSPTAEGASEAAPEAAQSRSSTGSSNGRTRTNTSDRGSATADRKTESRGTRNGSRSRNGRSSSSNSSSKAASDGSRDNYNWGRRVDSDEADQRSRQANRRRRGIRRADLDAPLPEDVAFRPGDEGGDSSILPTRRRRPVGFHDTARTLVGGARSVGTWVKRDSRHGQEHEPDDVETNTADPGEEAADRNVARAARQLVVAPKATPSAPATDDESDTDSDAGESRDDGDDGHDDERPRRRRGRRGGRGRRRSEGAEAAESSDEPSTDEDDEGDEPESAPHDTDERDDDHDADDDERPRRERRTTSRPKRALAPVAEEDLPAAFAALKIHRTNLEQLARFGFDQPTPIQEEAIPALLNGLDVVGIAQTGSGKTIAFSLPMVEKLDPELPEVQGIVLVPTRELAQQVLDVLTEVAAPWGLQAVGLLGGRSLKADFRALDDRPHIVVGTPGRILDHLRRQTLSLRHVRYAVLDEADQMLDIGFLPDIRRILSRTPQRRQTALFSATMPTSIRRLIWQFMTDPETVRVDAEATTVDTIEQIYFEVAQRDKVKAMRELIERELKGRSLIFCNMKRSVDHLARELERDGVSVRALHGDLDQRQRERVVQELRSGKLDAVIATNVAARGLDIPEITHVVNFDVPQNLEEYVHRIGRTGRAGREGKAITFVCEWDVDQFDAIQQGVPAGIRREELDLYRPPSAPPATPAAPATEAEAPAASTESSESAESSEDAASVDETPPVEDTSEAIPVTATDDDEDEREVGAPD